MDKPAIQIENVSKMYKLYANDKDKLKDAFRPNWIRNSRKPLYTEFWALSNINISINKGERIGLIGRNGSGKSTLLKILCNNIKPTTGTYKINGKIQAMLQLGTGFHSEYTGIENIHASLLYEGCTEKQIAKLTDEIIDFSELGDFIEQPIKTYSAGMLARLAFSISTSMIPDILIIDEVLGAGDAYFAAKCVEKMKELTEDSGATVLFVSHDLSAVQRLCNRAILLQKGMITDEDLPLPIIKKYSSLVRKDEEIRLRAKDFKKTLNKTFLEDKTDDIYKIIHIELSQSQGNESKIRHIDVSTKDGRNLYKVDVGAPMDNNLVDNIYIYDSDEFTTWSSSKKDEKGFYRTIFHQEGKMARIALKVPESDINDAQIKIYGDFSDTVKMSIRDRDYNILRNYPKIISGDNYSIIEDIEKTKNNDNIINFKDNSNGYDYIKKEGFHLSSVFLTNSLGESGNVFSYDNSLEHIIIKCIAYNQIQKFTGALFIYKISGELIVADLKDFMFEKPQKEIDFDFVLKNFKLGAGEYNITFALYESVKVNPLDNSYIEPLIQLDRSCNFKIENRIDYFLSVPSIYVPIDTQVTSGETKAKSIHDYIFK